MGEIGNKVASLTSEEPIGIITPRSDTYGVDEAGRAYVYESIESKERKRLYASYKRDKRHFTFTHMQRVLEITESLTNKQCGYVLMLQPYIQYETNVLVTAGRNPKPLDINAIAKIFGIQRRYAKQAIQTLTDASVIMENGDQYLMNERYHFRKKAGGKADMLVKTFHTAVKGLKLSPSELGIIYKLIPFIHYNSNLLCSNPHEKDDNNVNVLSKSQIASLLGISRQKFDQVIKELTLQGVVAEVKRKATFAPNARGDGREIVILINPSIATRLRGDPGSTIKQIFGL
ncbi:hypothetical protein [Lentibacillus daqui]|uniref:hypothetical protein n=1 Tax=Lentibacillus daqui TaxID=2911514 RepID=UPI0022B1582F|nr:hypothetical protein [Lentibacillus daqui]